VKIKDYLTETVKYKLGDIIEYISMGGERRIVKIVNTEKNIKKGYPGFDGDEVDPKTFKPTGETYWGYDDQILKVVKKK